MCAYSHIERNNIYGIVLSVLVTKDKERGNKKSKQTRESNLRCKLKRLQPYVLQHKGVSTHLPGRSLCNVNQIL